MKNDFFKNHLESFPDCENVFASFFLQDSSGLIFEIQSALEFTADTFEISYQMNIFLNKYHGRTCSCQHGLLVLETPVETQFLTKTLNLKHHCVSYAHQTFLHQHVGKMRWKDLTRQNYIYR